MSSALESSLAQEVKAHLASLQSNELIFSYGLDSTFFSTGINPWYFLTSKPFVEVTFIDRK